MEGLRSAVKKAVDSATKTEDIMVNLTKVAMEINTKNNKNNMNNSLESSIDNLQSLLFKAKLHLLSNNVLDPKDVQEIEQYWSTFSVFLNKKE
jgi:hypothetical protein